MKKLRRKIRKTEEQIEQQQIRLRKQLEEEQALILQQNEFSIELLKKSNYRSLEEQKLRTAEEIVHGVETELTHNLDALRAKITEILAHNRLLSQILLNLLKSLKLEEEKEERYLKSKRSMIVSEKEANAVIKRLIEAAEDPGLKRMLGKGAEGLERIEKKLFRKIDIDVEKEKFLVIMEQKLKNLRKLIERQNRLASMLKKKAVSEHATQLLDLVKQEIIDHNNILREYYQHINLKDEEQRIIQLQWLNESELELSNDTVLFLNQYNIPRINFPSGVYAVYSVNDEEAKIIISKGVIDSSTGRVHRKLLAVGSQREELRYLTYTINDILNITKCCFIFPLEKIMKNRYFLVEDFTRGILEIYNKGPNPSFMYGQIQGTIPKFQELVKNINQKFNEWLEEAKKMDAELVHKWDVQAAERINADFTKRWIRDESHSFTVEQQFSFDIVKFLVEQRYFAELFSRLTGQATQPRIDKTTDDYLEELQAMSKDRFISTVRLVEKSYISMMTDIRNFVNKASFEQDISEGIFIAPKYQVIFWERFFQTRPNVFYYSGEDVKQGIKQAIQKCKKNKKNKQIPKTKFIRVFSYMNMKPLRTA